MSVLTADQKGLNLNGSTINNVGNGNLEGQAIILSQLQIYVPTGTVKTFAGASAPAEWLLCNGSEVSRTTYENLFSTIGTTYGSGDGSTTFNVPNLQGKVPIGSDGETYILGNSGGSKTHALTVNEIATHTHAGSSDSAGSHTHTGTTNNAGGHSHTNNAVGSNPSNSDSAGNFGVIQQSYGGQGVTPTGFDNGNSGTELNIYQSFALTINSVGDHSHGFTTGSSGSHTHTFTTESTGSGSAFSIMQPYLCMNYIIKI